ncbi:hypothetical protein L596_013296 [Steinernema carpocapsae]|uniref:Uncharacterized protein n=1 Tax=Steinernema carpocapsae TaxID=34508 RepID=A0A4U5NZW7_STECR|nr:hypothetical protein L596_013296 [Steinernema carpocapsae]
MHELTSFLRASRFWPNGINAFSVVSTQRARIRGAAPKSGLLNPPHPIQQGAICALARCFRRGDFGFGDAAGLSMAV